REGDVFGDGVNIAARLQALADPDSSCISDMVYRDVANKLDLGTVVSLGKPKLKNIAERFTVYALLPQSPKGIRQTLHVQWLKLSRRVRPMPWVAVGMVLALIAGGLLATQTPFLSAIRTPQSPIRNEGALPLPDKPSIVVLPFDNMSKDPEQDYFSNGITEVLTSDLSRIASLFVIARNTAFTYKGKPVNIQDVGKELGVRYVLEGSVQRAGEQVRITAQLIDATTGGHLWTQRFDRPFADIFALQDEIVKKIMTTLKLQLSVQEQGYIVRKHTDNLEAYDSLLRGVEPFWRFTKEAHTQAQQMFERAIALDPQYAEAYARLSFIYYREWFLRWSMDPQTLEHALALAQQAVALDDALPLAHSLLGQVYTQKRQYDQALAEGERAIALDPNNADSSQWQANVLNFVGRPEEALRMMERAMRLNPRYPPFYLFELGWAYSSTGRYTEAITTLREFLSRSPSHPPGHHLLALNYMYQWTSQQSADPHTLEHAVAAAQRGLAFHDAYFVGHRVLGSIHLWQKQYEQAMAELERSIALDPNMADGYAFLAETLSRVGRPEEALRAAEQALRLRPLVLDYHLDSVGTTYYLAGRHEEAIAPLKQYLTRYPNILGAHLTLAAVYSELGKEAEAQAEVAEVLRLNPNFSLEVYKQRAPIKDPAVLERHIVALRKAGLK
ncbi:MAG: tetratricopeptide repeat protein, partial [Deltaproteobacteria bacterium]|nr:tetratricopeptide repeat protein [Deltaproteobacteria bacterium]